MAIVDQYGSPVYSSRLLDAAAGNNGDRPSWPTRVEGIQEAVSHRDRKTVLSASRRLYANHGIAKGPIDQKAMYSIGRAWGARFEGGDGSSAVKAWSEAATAWINDVWYPTCSVYGSNHDFVTDLYIDSVAIDRDGEFGILLTETEDGYPQTQRVPAHLIGQRDGSQKVVGPNDALTEVRNTDGTFSIRRGVYAGLRIRDGVITNKVGRPVAYRILGETPEEDRDISARDFIHVGDPSYHDQLRYFPALTHAINDLRDMQQSQKWEQLAQLIQSSIGLIEYSENGEDPNDPQAVLAGTGAATSGEMTARTLMGGLIRHIKAGGGNKIEAMKSDRPGEAWESFWDRLTRACLLGLNWSYVLTWKPSDGNAASQRSELIKVQCSIDDRQDLLRRPARQMVGYAISKAIKLGILPPYPGKDPGGFLKWGFAMPPKLTIDKGRDAAAWLQLHARGAENITPWLASNGRTLEEHYTERAYEIAARKRIAREVSKKEGVEIDPREMMMLTPNDMAQSAEDETSKTVDTKEETE